MLQGHDGGSIARDEAYEGRALVAAFADRTTAHEAADRLRDEGFHRVWLGVTQPASVGSGQVVRTEDETLGEKIARFFGADESTSLYDALVRHGVAESEARRVDASLAASSTILTVDGSNHPELAAQIVEQSGGHILAGESFEYGGATAAAGAAATPISGSAALGYRSPERYARGEEIDEQRRVRLREERLQIDKAREQRGEARVGKDVVEHRQDVDVPVVREELFVERRPVAETAGTPASEPIAEGETVRIPLMRERIQVTKRPVVTGEVVVGKRAVTETQHVSETTREERLRVDDPSRKRTTETE